MQYLLLIYGNEAGMQSASKADMEQMMAAYGAYTEAMKKAGVLVGANRLQPTASATTVRVADGKTKVLDGPYAETKEQLGGYYLIDVPDLDAALSWAARCPGASYGSDRSAADLDHVSGRLARWRREATRATAEAVARRSYGKLVAFLAARTRRRRRRRGCAVRRLRGRAHRLAEQAASPTIPKAG